MSSGGNNQSDQVVARRPEEDAAVLSAVLSAAAEGIVVIDADGTIQSVNPAVLRMFGYLPGELPGRNVSVLMPSRYAAHHDGYIGAFVRTGTAKIIGIGREVEGLRKDGTIFPVGLAVSEVQLPDRRFFAGILRDLSEQRDAESKARTRLHELAHAARLLELGEMTSGLGHEINQPLTAIVTFAQACRRMLASGQATPELLEDTLGQIVKQGERAAAIVKGLRDFARKHNDTTEVVPIAALVDDVVTLLRHELRRSGVTLTVGVPSTRLEVDVARIQVEQVLVNLIRNAVDAMDAVPRGRRSLAISVTLEGDDALALHVEDSGVGVASEHLPRLFDAYFTTKSDGMGVGLAISKTIIESHGGALRAENRSDRGACFTAVLPLFKRRSDDETAHCGGAG